MPTIEHIYAAVVREGVRRGHFVVPEFCATPSSRLFQKNIDVAWLEPRDEPDRIGSLRRWRIVAAFEIEGYDVPIERIQTHSAQFEHLQADEGTRFPCIVPLYTQAHHRANPTWGNAAPQTRIAERQAAAKAAGGMVKVCDGRELDWLLDL
ncbi:MAG: hypothetical protein EON54_10645 [Alcaligenaceae bacterium]|nr:MAG: hypothetical protein EON54_10645 [Alcaligenaceae bacterium]